MVLIIDGKLAKIGQEVTTGRPGKGILLGWYEPYQGSDIAENYGEVLIKEPWMENPMLFYPCAINGEFRRCWINKERMRDYGWVTLVKPVGNVSKTGRLRYKILCRL